MPNKKYSAKLIRKGVLRTIVNPKIAHTISYMVTSSDVMIAAVTIHDSQ
jgi:hypothetical protein